MPDTAPPSTSKRWYHNNLSRHLSFAAVLLTITLSLIYSNWLQRADLLIYDSHQQLWSRPAPDDVVIIGIDEYSLSQLGRWPWPRRTHAELIDKLTEAGSRAIVLDIILAEPDQYDREGDALLAQAIQRNNRVVLPLLFEQRYAGGQLIETLPLPSLIAAAHSLGHAHIELDADGIARSVYLKEGVANAYWPHLSIALLELIGIAPKPLPGTQTLSPNLLAPNTLQRDHHLMTPYAGPPGHFTHISYAKLLEEPDRIKDLKNKIVFIGATATGLGDLLPTPLSALHQPMAGVELNANIFDALREGVIVEPTTLGTRLLLGAFIVLLPVLLFPRLSPRTALLMSGTLLLGTLLLSTLLLIQCHLWLPPAAPLLTLILAYPLWSWQRLEYANRFLSLELKQLQEEQALQPCQSKDIERAMTFIRNLIPIEAWTLYQGRSRYIAHWGQRLVLPVSPPQEKGSAESWHQIRAHKEVWWLGIAISDNRAATQQESALILDIVSPCIEEATPPPISAVELFEERVIQVQHVKKQILALRHFLDNSLNQMADGILIINNLGLPIFINAKALGYLDVDSDFQAQQDKPIITLLSVIEITNAEEWPQLLAKALLHATPTQANARTSTGLDLQIQVNPVSLEQQQINGVIINLSDISHIRASERQRLETFSFLSHDLRAPLTSLLALVEISQDKERLSTDEAFLKRVKMYANRTLSLAEDFLQVSELEHRTELHFELVDIGMIITNAIDAIWDQSSKKNIRIIDTFPEEPIYIKGNPGLLERALLNLLDNSVKYSDDNTTIEVSLKREDKKVLCCIQDAGFGIDEEAQPKIFDHYFRSDNPNSSGIKGSGLGLSFVKSVAEKHGGSILIESQAGKGTFSCLQLPLAPNPAKPSKT